MAKSTPDDLAVAFRSLARRLRDAQHDDNAPSEVATAEAAVQGAVTAAATVLGAAPTPDDVAAAIQERHIEDWKDHELDALQTHANDAARAIRTLDNSSN
jgi:hypothetical protein